MPVDTTKPELFSIEHIAECARVPALSMRSHIRRMHIEPDAWLFESGKCRALFSNLSVDRILRNRKKSWLGDEAEVQTYLEQAS